MYLDLCKVPTIVMLGKRTFIINNVGDDDMDVFRLNWSTSALAVIGVHCNPASRRPPMHFLLHKALESSAILCTVPQIHLYFRMHSKKASHRTWSWGWGQGCEKRILSRNKMSITHPYQNCCFDLLWQPAASRKRPLELHFSPELTEREKKETLHFPSLDQVWTQLHWGVTCWSILLKGTTASTSISTSCLFPHFELLVRSSISTKVFAHFKRAALPRDEGKLVWFSEISSFKRNLWIFSLERKGIPSSWNILLQDTKDWTESV